MISITKKHKTFVSEPIGHKKVHHLPGIGKTLQARMEAKQFGTVMHILGMFLLMEMDREKFLTWMNDQFEARPKDSVMCYNALHVWCLEFIM